MSSPNQDQNTAETRQRKIIHIDMDAFYASVESGTTPTYAANLKEKIIPLGRRDGLRWHR